MTSNTTKQGLIERLEAISFMQDAPSAPGYRDWCVELNEAIEIIRTHPEPEVSEEVVEVLKEAQETIDTLHREGNWDNGVYDPTGAISEGIVQTSKYVYSTLDKIDAVLEAYLKATTPPKEAV